MTEDQAKAPRATPAPAMSLLDRQIADAKGRMCYAKSDDLARYYAERLAGLRFERGDFPIIQRLDHATHKGLARALLRERKAH
jgi:hypothetical protein